jgi:hypothetical protein
MLMVTDEVVGERWIQLNQPMVQWSGRMDPRTGQPLMEPILLPETDPASGEIITDEDGNIILAPVNEVESEFSQMEFQVRVESTAYNDEDEKAQLMLESVMSGQIGQMMAQVNPSGFFQMSALALKSAKTKYTPQIVQVLEQTAAALGGNPQMQQGASMMAQQGGAPQSPKSKSLKLPTNTNEGAL